LEARAARPGAGARRGTAERLARALGVEPEGLWGERPRGVVGDPPVQVPEAGGW
jgi:hypothetical protein